MLDANETAEVRLVVAKHINACKDELINDGSANLGWWPESLDALTDAVMAVLRHQVAIDDFHEKENTNFAA